MFNRNSQGARGGKLASTTVALVVAVVLAVAAVAVAAWLYRENNELKNDPKTIQKAQDKETEALVAKVGRLMALPGDEKPVVATVEDKEKLKDQPFFNDAQNGDKLIIYTTAKKAIVYRESENKIINVGPIAVTAENQNAAPEGTTPTTEQPAQPAPQTPQNQQR